MKTLSSIELRSLLIARYPKCIANIFDANYNVIAERAMPNFRRELGAELFDKYGDKWKDFNDCDNFALEALTLAYRKHYIARFEGGGSAQGVAFGMVCFLKNPKDFSSGHAINWRVTEDMKVMEFEPQTREDVILTPEQCASAFFVFVS